MSAELRLLGLLTVCGGRDEAISRSAMASYAAEVRSDTRAEHRRVTDEYLALRRAVALVLLDAEDDDGEPIDPYRLRNALRDAGLDLTGDVERAREDREEASRLAMVPHGAPCRWPSSLACTCGEVAS